jgi:hypothetical protein
VLSIDGWGGLSIGPNANFQPLNTGSEVVSVEPSGQDDLRNASSAKSSLIDAARTEMLARRTHLIASWKELEPP